jgi:hypothetical protein
MRSPMLQVHSIICRHLSALSIRVYAFNARTSYAICDPLQIERIIRHHSRAWNVLVVMRSATGAFNTKFHPADRLPAAEPGLMRAAALVLLHLLLNRQCSAVVMQETLLSSCVYTVHFSS